jgi:hypothetical protein
VAAAQLVVVYFCVLCFVFCVLVASGYFIYQRYLIFRKLISDQPKWPSFASSKQNIHNQTNQMLRKGRSSHGVRTSVFP